MKDYKNHGSYEKFFAEFDAHEKRYFSVLVVLEAGVCLADVMDSFNKRKPSMAELGFRVTDVSVLVRFPYTVIGIELNGGIKISDDMKHKLVEVLQSINTSCKSHILV